METDGRRMCELLVGLGEVDLVGVEELRLRDMLGFGVGSASLPLRCPDSGSILA